MYTYTCTAVLGPKCKVLGPICSFQRISWSRKLFTHAHFAPSLTRLFAPPRLFRSLATRGLNCGVLYTDAQAAKLKLQAPAAE